MSVAYPFRAVIIAPATLATLSAQIAQAIGPSSRDDLSFSSITATKDGITFQVCDVAITEETYLGYQAMQINPALLVQAVHTGWERKDMEGTPPEAAEILQWLNSAVIWLGDAWSRTGREISSILEELGFTYTPPVYFNGN